LHGLQEKIVSAAEAQHGAAKSMQQQQQGYVFLPETGFYERLVAELEEIGWDKITQLKSDLSSLSIKVTYVLLYLLTCS